MKTTRSTLLSIFLLTAGVVYAQPTVTAVLDGAALTNNLAQGSEFIVKGSGLSNANEYAPAPAPIYPTILKNVSISLTPTGGGAAVQMLMAYTYNLNGVNQLAAVIPSTVPLGNYNLKVTYNGTSSANFATTVVARKPGVVTADGSGFGIAQATINGGLVLQRVSVLGKIGDFDTRPAYPNDVITLWGTGLGADSPADSGGLGVDQTAAGNIRVLFNGNEIMPSYAGRSFGYPGLDQVNFSLPSDVALKCDNTVQVRAGGVLSNSSTIATAAANATSCPSSTNTGGGNGNTNVFPTQSEINSWIAAGKFRIGSVSLTRDTSYTTSVGGTVTSSKDDSIDASFSSITGTSTNLSNYLNAFSTAANTIGSCTVITNISTNPFPGLTLASLDAGTPIGITGPNGSRSIPRTTNSGSTGVDYSYSLDLGSSSNYLSSGNYTATVPGSSSVGAFSGSVTVPSEFSWTNRTSVTTINRSQGVHVTWSGGDSGGFMNISGSSTSFTGSSLAIGTFSCTAKMSDNQFTVPSSVLNQLPATGTTGGIVISYGTLSLDASATPTRVSVNGLDYATISSDVSISQSTIYQ